MIRLFHPAFAVVFALGAGAVAARAASPVVVELFTSEGCSSCPPADRFLAELARTRPDVLPLDLHVTYWNRLGWTDPFSLDAATERQDRYAALFHEAEVYTPEMVIDGGTDLVGSDRQAVLARIASAESVGPAPVALGLERGSDGLTVTVGDGKGNGRLVLLGFDSAHDTAVGGGENGGRTLHEVNVVRSIRQLGDWTGHPLTIHVEPPEGQRAAILLEGDRGRILAASVAG